MLHRLTISIAFGATVLVAAVNTPAYGPGGFYPVAYNAHYAARHDVRPAFGWRTPARPRGHTVLTPPSRPQASATRAPSPSTGTARGPSKASATGRPALRSSAKSVAQSAPEVVAPVEVERIPADLDGAPVAERKRRFLEILTPLVLLENRRLSRLRDEAATLVAALESGKTQAEEQLARLRALAREYRVEGDPGTDAAARHALLDRIDTIPVSLALAQAANESAWGSSRFAREAQNLFGIWTYDESEGIVPKRRAAGKKHLVRRFDSLRDSVRYYMYTLNSHPAYEELRARRARYRENGVEPPGMDLSEGLERYSAKGVEYVRAIQDMIEDNRLFALENARLAG